MRFRYLVAAPLGDIELSPADLTQPFRTGPAETHPFLTLNDYFGALQQFILAADAAILRAAMAGKNRPEQRDLAAITEIVIRSEKHGAFYHIASIGLAGLEEQSRFAVTTALADGARASLAEEFYLLQNLAAMVPDRLPALFGKQMVTRRTAAGSVEFLMVLGEWFSGYHEWHLAVTPQSRQQIQLWDYAGGFRFLTDAESYELLRQAAGILTACYDQASFRQIYPWHHGAGDFIVKADSGAVSVKLITARQYEPLVYFDRDEEADRLVAAIHFLLNLSLRIRLDRLDGVGEPAWLAAFAVRAAVAGFFDGLAAAAAAGRPHIGPAAEFLAIMQSFTVGEIFDMYGSLLEIYGDEDPDDFRLIGTMLPAHAKDLHNTLQEFTL